MYTNSFWKLLSKCQTTFLNQAVRLCYDVRSKTVGWLMDTFCPSQKVNVFCQFVLIVFLKPNYLKNGLSSELTSHQLKQLEQLHLQLKKALNFRRSIVANYTTHWKNSQTSNALNRLKCFVRFKNVAHIFWPGETSRNVASQEASKLCTMFLNIAKTWCKNDIIRVPRTGTQRIVYGNDVNLTMRNTVLLTTYITITVMRIINFKLFPVPVRLHSGYGKLNFVVISQ